MKSVLLAKKYELKRWRGGGLSFYFLHGRSDLDVLAGRWRTEGRAEKPERRAGKWPSHVDVPT